MSIETRSQSSIIEALPEITQEPFNPYKFLLGVTNHIHNRRQELVEQYPGENIGFQIRDMHLEARATLESHGIDYTGYRIIGSVAARDFKTTSAL